MQRIGRRSLRFCARVSRVAPPDAPLAQEPAPTAAPVGDARRPFRSPRKFSAWGFLCRTKSG